MKGIRKLKITFNSIGSGLSNNGGSDTIVRSANTLIDLGHEVSIIDSKPIRYTWHGIKPKHIMINGEADYKNIPTADVVIATGYQSVRKMLHFPERCGKKFHWVRGWETWNYPEVFITWVIMKYPVVRMVNGIQLQEKLESLGVESHLVRPGYDFDQIKPIEIDRGDDAIILGGLYSDGKKRKTKRVDWIFKTVKQLQKEGHNVKLWMFGTDKNPKNELLTRYFCNPTASQKSVFYNLVDIWLAPTELEGLHRPPAEAMLANCPVVGTDAELSGMDDYLVDNVSGLIAENNLADFIRKTRSLVVQEEFRNSLGKGGRTEVLNLGSRGTNMQHMVEVFKRYAE
jgi:glycosyltransferase involved in cell wall biosynthesis